MSLTFDELPYGQCYIFKGNTNKFFWLLNQMETPNYFLSHTQNIDNLLDLFPYENTDYIMLKSTGNFTLNKNPTVNPTVRIFILLNIYDSLETTEKKIYKKYSSSKYTTLDYSKWTIDDDPNLHARLTELEDKCDYEILDYRGIYKRLKHYPISFSSFMDEVTETEFRPYESTDVIAATFQKIAVDKSGLHLQSLLVLDKNTIHSYFYPPFSRLASICKTDLSWSLYYWYKYFYHLLKTKFSTRDIAFLYFNWVYDCSTTWSTSQNSGLTYYIKGRNKFIYYFAPSHKALNVLGSYVI